jgi:hypothetical protein
MILRFRIGHYRFTVALIRFESTYGLNSKLADGNHVLMWDFDGVGSDIVIDGLRYAQKRFQLPNIYLFGSSPPNHYLALCLQRTPWVEVVHIITSIPIIDSQWLRGGVSRQYFTIRIGMKRGNIPILLKVLRSKRRPTVKISELPHWDRYETLG